MKKLYLLLLAFYCFLLPIVAQNGKAKVAIFDPTTVGEKSNIDVGTATAIREIISSTIVNSGMYSIVERALLDNVMKEQEFSNSGAVDESQASEIGKLAGADKVVVSIVTELDGEKLFSIKILDTQTATVERQKTRWILKDQRLGTVVEAITRELIKIDNVNSQVVDSSPTISYKKQDSRLNSFKEEYTYSYKKGYKGFVEVGGSFGLAVSDNDDSEYEFFTAGVSTTHGTQITPYLFIGAGLSIEYTNLNEEELFIPLYGEVRCNFLNPQFVKNTPYIGFRAGCNMVDLESDDIQGVFNLFLGNRFPINKKIALNVDAGYRYITVINHGASIRLGIEF